MRSVNRRYYIEFLPAMTAYMLILLFAWHPILRIQSVPLRALGALLPVLPTVFVVRAIFRRVVGGDELERRISLESLAIASTVVGLGSFAVAFQVIAKIIAPSADVLIWVLPALFGLYGVGKGVLTVRYARE